MLSYLPPTPTASFSHKLLAMILLKLKFKINPFPQQNLGQVGELALGSTSEKTVAAPTSCNAGESRPCTLPEQPLLVCQEVVRVGEKHSSYS